MLGRSVKADDPFIHLQVNSSTHLLIQSSDYIRYQEIYFINPRREMWG